jgi:eukaryotic-like serine/threonine-protein kinase
MTVGPGTRLDGYELLQILGSGGMGEVWLARDSVLGRKLALKLLPDELTGDPARVARFEQEARAASALNHQSICQVYALGRSADGQRYIAMELVDGTTLRSPLKTGPMTLAETLSIAAQIAAAVSAAHAAGIVHRDLKPENVMVKADGLVKVLDFGLAKLSTFGDSAASGDALTHTVLRTDAGTVVGTMAYMSPEQARGQTVDARTDVWSLGVLVYEMASGRRPFGGQTTSDVLVSILERQPEPLRLQPNTPPELQRIVTKSLQKDRERRYQVMKDLQLDIEALRDGLAHPIDDDRPLIDETVRYKRIAAAAIIAALAITSASVWWAAHVASNKAKSGLSAEHVGSQALRRLTVDPGLQTDVTWSPDGNSVAYSSDRAGNFDIWVQRVDEGEARQLTRSPAQDTEPTWSPDGTTIVFRSDRDGGGLFAIPSTGGAERRLTTSGVRPRWAPDGSAILFASSDSALVPDLYTVRLDGKSATKIDQPFLKRMVQIWGWDWYPDSRQISIMGFSGTWLKQTIGIYTMPLTGGQPRLLEQTSGSPLWLNFAWTAAGSALYVEDIDHDVRSIRRLTVDPGTMKVVRADRVTAGDEWEHRLAISRDARRVAFTLAKMSLRLWTFPFDASTGRITGQGQPITDADARVDTADLSFDGARVVYDLRRQGTSRHELWMTDVDSGHSRQLANDDQVRDNPAWSRDGRMLAYAWSRDRRHFMSGTGIAVRRLDSDEEQLITTPQTLEGALTPFGWSPDGRHLLATLLRSSYKGDPIVLCPLDAAPHAETAVKVLASDENVNLWQERYSPDGRWILFQAHQPEQAESVLFVIPSTGANRADWTPVTDPGQYADKPRWSPDGTRLYYVLRQGSFVNVWGRRFDPAQGRPVGSPFQITHFNTARRQLPSDAGAAEIGVSARRLILTIVEETGNIWMLDDVNR